MNNEYCPQHEMTLKEVERLREKSHDNANKITELKLFEATQNQKNEKYDVHVYDGEKTGGARDRLAKCEVLIDALVQSQQRNFVAACIGGFIGGLLGRFMPWFMEVIGKFLGLIH